MEHIFSKYGQTQSLNTAETDLPRVFVLIDNLEKHQKDVGAAKKWLDEVLPEKAHEAENMAEDYGWKAENVRGLIGDLQADIASAKGLLAAEENIQQTLATLEPIAATRLKQTPVDPATLHDFATAVDTVAMNVEQLGEDVAARSQERVQTPHDIRVPEDRQRVARLRASFDAARTVADAAAATAAADADFAHVNADLSRKMDTAANADSDPNADKTSLSSAIEELNRAEADFNKLYEIYDRIEPSNSEAEELRTKLGDELAKADEQFKTLTIALDDKLAGLTDFDNASKTIKDKIDDAKRAAAAATTPEQLRALLQETIPAIEQDLALLKDSADALEPIAAPVATATDCEKALDDLRRTAEDRLQTATDNQCALDALQNEIAAACAALDAVQQHLAPAAVVAPTAEEPKKSKKKDKKKGKEAAAPVSVAGPSVSREELEKDVARLREQIVPALEKAANTDIEGAEGARARAAEEMRRAVAAVGVAEAAVATAKAQERAGEDVADAAVDYRGLLAVLSQFPDLEKVDADDATETPIKKAVAEEGLTKIDDLLKRLAEIPASSLTPEKAAELEELKKTLEAKKAALVALLAALANQDDLLNEWEARKAALFKLQEPLEKEMEELFTSYTTPQRYDIAVADAPRMPAMSVKMDAYQKAVVDAKNWAHDRLPSKEHEADNLLAAGGWEAQQIQELTSDTAVAIGSAAAIKEAFDKLHDGIVKMECHAVEINSPEKVDETALVRAKQELVSLEAQLAELDGDIASRPQDRVLNPTGLDVEGARSRIQNVHRLLNAKADSLAIEKDIVEATTRFNNGADAFKSMIDQAAKVDADPAATAEQLQEAADTLNESRNDIAYMQNEHDHFNPANQAGEELKTRMVDELAKALEELAALEMSIEDKIAGLGMFKDDATKAKEALQRVKESSPAADTPEKMEALLKTLEEAKADVLNLEERAEELAPLEAPRKQSAALAVHAAELAKQLADDLEKSREADAKKKEMRAAIDKAKEAVQTAVDLLVGDESDKKDKPKKKKGKKERKESETKKVPTADELQRKIADLTVELKPLDDIIAFTLDAPTEKRDAEDLKKAAADVVANMQKAIAKEIEAKALADGWEKMKEELTHIQLPLEKELEELFTRYSTPQPLPTSEEDVAYIHDIRTRLIAYKSALKEAKEWTQTNLPEKEHEADNLIADLQWKMDNTDALKKDLDADVESAYEIVAMNDEIEGKLADLETSDDVEKLMDKAADLKPVVEQLAKLLASRCQDRVLNPDANPEDQRRRLETLATALADQKKAIEDEKKCDEASTSFADAKEKLRGKIDDIAKADEDAAATVASLSDASDKAREAKKDLGRMNEAYAGLDSTSPQADELRSEMLYALECNDQELGALAASIDDKLSALKTFNDKYDAVTGRLDLIMTDAAKAVDLPRMDQVKTELDALKPEAEALPSIAEEIYGVTEPAKKAQQVIDDLNKTGDLLEIKIAAATEKNDLTAAIRNAVEKAKDSTKKIEDDVKSSSPESAAKGKKGKKGKKDSSPGVEAPLADTIAALQRLSEQLDPLESAYADSALAVPVDAPTEKKEAEKARQNAQDLASRIADDIKNKKDELENQNKARAVEDALAKIGDKIDSILAPYSEKPQSLTKAESDMQKIADLLAKDLASVPIDQLADPSSAAATAAKLKQRAKETIVPLEKEIEAEKKLANDADAVEAQEAQLEKELDSVRNKTDDPAAAIAAIADIADRARKLRPTAEAIETAYDATRPLVAHSAPKPEIASRIDNLLAEADRANSQQNEAAQIAALAPEIEKMHELVVTKADEAVPEALADQQANLEDLEGRRKKLEDILAGLPQSGPGVDELRAKSEWDLSRLKDLLKKLGDAVGDKLAALAAWNALRKGAEAQLVDLTKEKPVPKDASGLEKAVEDLANDEKALEALAQDARDGVNPDDLDEDEKKKRDDLLNQIEKALALIKARKAAAEKALKDAQESDKLAADLAKIDSRLAPLVEEATRLLQDPDAIPSAYTSTAQQLNAATEEARPIVDAGRSSKGAKTLAGTIKKAEKVTPVLDERFKLWNEFVDAREVANAQLDKFNDDLTAKEHEDAALSIEEAERLLAELEVIIYVVVIRSVKCTLKKRKELEKAHD
ncbi:hypothetical protein PRIPAC_86838 [Pristionchus pacificus]|nr:hypothetical protein PRIPAC_86838 [Pristionchus pacificus]